MKKRNILSWIVLAGGLICIYNSIGIAEFLACSNRTVQNLLTIILVVIGICLSGISLTISKGISQTKIKGKYAMCFFRLLILAIASMCCSKVLLNSSVFGTIFIFCALNYITTATKVNETEIQKPSLKLYGATSVICLVGLVIILAGKFWMHLDQVVMLGAIIVAAMITPLGVNLICNLWRLIWKKH